ncbi:MAG: DUF3549 family protein [Candidatus Thiodiazotropha sp. (ex Monitilora ramsayi)]|nr:DUF3549 family protein [Candidatus Thiodiazotropha sp. (ex Monitilora ramsayi)]
MQQITTLIEFLEAGSLNPRFYDMGRRLISLPRDQFLSFERTEIAYPQPLQQQAWIALLLQPDNDPVQTDPLIWFIRFPLDEQGKLMQAARDDFMFQLLERLGNALQPAEQRQEIESALEQNPYAFQPKQERLAAFHARITVELGQSPSRYYAHAKRYFDGDLGWDQWSFIGYQGIADIAARYHEAGNIQRIASAIPHLPPTALEALCHCLENETIPDLLAKALLDRTLDCLSEPTPDPQVITSTLRGISHSESMEPRHQLVEHVLKHTIAQRSDILAAVAGRLWQDLVHDDLRTLFLERLAENLEGQDFFNQILSDLLYLTATRQSLLGSLRDPARSERLSQAIGTFFTYIKNG